MSKVLIDTALVVIALVASHSLMGCARQFMVLFAHLRAEMAKGMPTQAMLFTTRSTSANTTLAPIAAMGYQPAGNIACNGAGALGIMPLPSRRPAAIRAAA